MNPAFNSAAALTEPLRFEFFRVLLEYLLDITPGRVFVGGKARGDSSAHRDLEVHLFPLFIAFRHSHGKHLCSPLNRSHLRRR